MYSKEARCSGRTWVARQQRQAQQHSGAGALAVPCEHQAPGRTRQAAAAAARAAEDRRHCIDCSSCDRRRAQAALLAAVARASPLHLLLRWRRGAVRLQRWGRCCCGGRQQRGQRAARLKFSQQVLRCRQRPSVHDVLRVLRKECSGRR